MGSILHTEIAIYTEAELQDYNNEESIIEQQESMMNSYMKYNDSIVDTFFKNLKIMKLFSMSSNLTIDRLYYYNTAKGQLYIHGYLPSDATVHVELSMSFESYKCIEELNNIWEDFTIQYPHIKIGVLYSILEYAYHTSVDIFDNGKISNLYNGLDLIAMQEKIGKGYDFFANHYNMLIPKSIYDFIKIKAKSN